MTKQEFFETRYYSKWVEYKNYPKEKNFSPNDRYCIKAEDGKIVKIVPMEPSLGWFTSKDYPKGMIKRAEELKAYEGKTTKEFWDSLTVPKGKKIMTHLERDQEDWEDILKNFESNLQLAKAIAFGKNPVSYWEYVPANSGDFEESAEDILAKYGPVYLKFSGDKVEDVVKKYQFDDEKLDCLHFAEVYMENREEMRSFFIGKDIASLNQSLNIAGIYPQSAENFAEAKTIEADNHKKAHWFIDGKAKHMERVGESFDAAADPLDTKMKTFANGVYDTESGYCKTAEVLANRKQYMYKHSTRARAARADKQALKAQQTDDKLIVREEIFASKPVKAKDDDNLIYRRNFIKSQRERK